MQLSLLFAVMAALVVAENCPCQPVTGVSLRLVAGLMGMGLVTGFAAITSGVTARGLRREFHRRDALLRRFGRFRRIHAVLWLAVTGVILFGLDWAQLVRFNWHLHRAFLLDDLLILLPVLLPLVLSWAAFYEVAYAFRVAADGENTLETRLSSRWDYVLLQVRHYLGILLLPIFLLIAFQDAAELCWPGVLDGAYGPLVYVPPFALLFVLFPALLRWAWQTSSLPAGHLRNRLELVADQTGFRFRDIVVWHTGGYMVNAAVAGFVSRFRYVYLTDGLLRLLTLDELTAVFGHEVGHVRLRHLPMRVMTMLAPVGLWFSVDQLFPGATELLRQWLLAHGAGTQVPLALVLVVAMVGYVMVVFGLYSRMLESQADLFGWRVATEARSPDSGKAETPDDQANTSALMNMISGLEKLTAAAGQDRRKSGWQHASVSSRVDFLIRAAGDPAYEARFHRKIQAVTGLLLLILLSPVVIAILL